ncbi:arabinosyltransferase domain-containing protein [Pseudonocardia xishanensis]|uniref:Arabinosyltransferase domain-containing protein n=1 Tax=Pseudonocardia xishanensis TaxID=630995 RepID=A0ABP8RRE9_9PSEU
MVSPVRPAPDTLREDPPPSSARRPGLLAVVLGLVVLVCAAAFPLAPVVQPRAEYAWGGPGAVPTALPLMPYQPTELTATVGCTRVPGTLVTTVPANADPTAAPLDGLTVAVVDDTVRVTSAGVELAAVPVPAGDCTVAVHSDTAATSVLLDGAPVVTRTGDLRPAVAALQSDRPELVAVQLTADTRFQTTITPLKAAIAVVGVLALLAMVVLLEARGRIRWLPRRWWRPRLSDLGVTAVLGVWWVVGPITVDDGYIAGIVRDRASSGFVGNVYRWLNAPEAPFSWFYDLYWLWAQISPSTVWMRLPSILIGLVTWGLLTRLLLPRLLPRAAGRLRWLAALCFLLWWLPLTLGLRPEPWVALGMLGAVLLVERAVALRRVTPLVLALVVAGATTAVTPGGLMAFAPLVPAAVPLLRIVRRSGWRIVPVLLAAPAAAVFLMVSDQSLAGLLEATRVRTVIGGGEHWYDEYHRYALLLSTDLQGSLAKRAPVLLTVVAAVAVLWSTVWSRRNTPAVRLAVTFLLGLASMTTNPTKWTQHFGDLAGVGAGVLVVGVVVCGRRALAGRVAPWLAGLAALTVVGSLIWAGQNVWPFVSNWWGLTWSTVTPLLAGTAVATLWLGLGVLVVGALLLVVAWRRSGGRPVRPARWWPSPALVAVALVAAVVGLQVLTFARTSWTHRDDYTLASDAVSTLRGQPCGLQERMSVETDPAAGLLPVAAGSGGSVPGRAGPAEAPAAARGGGLPVVPTDAGGVEVPGVRAAGVGSTEWFALDRTSALPVVVTVSGTLRPGDTLAVEFAGPSDEVLARSGLSPSDDTPRDQRLVPPDGATRVRLAVDAPAGSDAAATLPRIPVLTRMDQLLPVRTEAILDWPVAFVFPCLTPAPLPLGTTVLPEWRVAPPQSDGAAGITYAPGFGGPFAAARLLVTERRMAGYLDGDPLRDPAQLYRWEPVASFATAQPQVADVTVSGLAGTGRTRVPGLDPIG